MIKSLDLGYTAPVSKDISQDLSFELSDFAPPSTFNLTTLGPTKNKRTLSDYCPSNVQKICRNTQSKELAN